MDNKNREINQIFPEIVIFKPLERLERAAHFIVGLFKHEPPRQYVPFEIENYDLPKQGKLWD